MGAQTPPSMLMYYGRKAYASLSSRVRARSYLRRHPQRTDFRSPDWDALWQQVRRRYPALATQEYRVDPARYGQWVADAQYPFMSYVVNRAEKYLEHQVSIDLLELPESGLVVDVAAGRSWFAQILRRRGYRVIAQDQAFATGLDGERLGGDACDMELPAACVDGITLHCSFEHFEGDSDSRFVAEAARVLRPGRRAVILPLYLHHEFINLTDPLYSKEPVQFDEGAATIASFGLANRYGRHYGLDAFGARVVEPALRHGMQVRAVRILGGTQVDPGVYLNFALVLTKR